MPFHFALQPVLRLRRSQQRQERAKLESIGSELAKARLRLEGLRRLSVDWSKQIQDSLGAGAPGAQLQWEVSRGERLAAAVAEQNKRVVAIESLRRTQLQKYMQARQRCALVESLLRHKLEAYRVEEARREQQRVDDLFLMRLHVTIDE